MFGDLFLFTNTINYGIAVNQLSGSVYANYLNSYPSLGVHENDLVDHASNCEVPALAGSILECRAGAPIHVWGQLDYQSRKGRGAVEAGTTRSKRLSGLWASTHRSAMLRLSPPPPPQVVEAPPPPPATQRGERGR